MKSSKKHWSVPALNSAIVDLRSRTRPRQARSGCCRIGTSIEEPSTQTTWSVRGPMSASTQLMGLHKILMK
jgi:hypothetical protein